MRIKPFKSQYAVTWDEYPTGISNPNGKMKMVKWCINNLKLDEITVGFYDHNSTANNSWILLTISAESLLSLGDDNYLHPLDYTLLDHGSLKAIIVDDYSKACELADFIDQVHTFNIIKRY